MNQPAVPAAQGNQPQTPQSSPNTPNFILAHWDKIVAILIAGVIGFFSAVFTTKSDISKLTERLVEVETKYKVSIEPKLAVLDQNLREMAIIKEKMKTLELRESTSDLISKQLEERLKSLRLETLKELNDLTAKVKK